MALLIITFLTNQSSALLFYQGYIFRRLVSLLAENIYRLRVFYDRQ